MSWEQESSSRCSMTCTVKYDVEKNSLISRKKGHCNPEKRPIYFGKMVSVQYFIEQFCMPPFNNAWVGKKSVLNRVRIAFGRVFRDL
jgi:hypothetical protein